MMETALRRRRPSNTSSLSHRTGGTISGERFALWTFAAVLLFCFLFYVLIGRNGWFLTDEWDYLAQRTAGNLSALFHPANEHWSTLPILAFRLLWQLVGVRSFVPYLALIVLLHLATAALLRVVMRRSGVAPWIATVTAAVFALFGAGYDNIEWPIQIGYCGSLTFGLLALILADHDGSFKRRDASAVLMGLASLMSSGIGVTMVIVVAVAIFLRRGWRIALSVVAPLAVIYLVWLVVIGREGFTHHAGLQEILTFTGKNSYAAFAAIGHLWGVGVLLAVMLATGAVIAWPRLSDAAQRRPLAAPVALLMGVVIFLVITGVGRGSIGPSPPLIPVFPSRYLHVEAALMLPALAISADAITQRWKVLTPAVLAVLLIGVPGNIAVLVDHTDQTNSQAVKYRNFILSLPRLPVAQHLPLSLRPDSVYDPWLTLGWLRDAVSSGRLPPPGSVSARDTASWTLRLALQPALRSVDGRCATLLLPATVFLPGGSTISSDMPVAITYLPKGGSSETLAFFGMSSRPQTYLLYQSMTLRISGTAPSQALTLCQPPGTDPA